jgi:hypothetical protein
LGGGDAMLYAGIGRHKSSLLWAAIIWSARSRTKLMTIFL